ADAVVALAAGQHVVVGQRFHADDTARLAHADLGAGVHHVAGFAAGDGVGQEGRVLAHLAAPGDFGLGEVFRIDDVQHVAVARGQPGRVDQQFAGPGGREDPDFFARQVVAPGGVGLLDRLADLGRVDGVLAPVGQEARHVDLAKPEEHGGVLDLAVVAEHIAVAGARDHGRIAGGVDDAPGQNHR